MQGGWWGGEAAGAGRSCGSRIRAEEVAWKGTLGGDRVPYSALAAVERGDRARRTIEQARRDTHAPAGLATLDRPARGLSASCRLIGFALQMPSSGSARRKVIWKPHEQRRTRREGNSAIGPVLAGWLLAQVTGTFQAYFRNRRIRRCLVEELKDLLRELQLPKLFWV
jgi:hypothetical protein